MSRIIRQAIAHESQMRAQFADYREAAYQRAAEVTRGRMLNTRARRAGIDSRQLFAANPTFVHAYASEELLEHLARYPRLTWEQFEREMFDGEQEIA